MVTLATAVVDSPKTFFAFKDDLNDSPSLSLWTFLRRGRYWWVSTVLGSYDGGRYRPVFDVHNASGYQNLTDNYPTPAARYTNIPPTHRRSKQ